MHRRLVARSTILISHLSSLLSSSRPPCDELEVAVPRNADGAFAAAVDALQVAALDVVVERPAMDLEPLQHVLVADDVREVLDDKTPYDVFTEKFGEPGNGRSRP